MCVYLFKRLKYLVCIYIWEVFENFGDRKFYNFFKGFYVYFCIFFENIIEVGRVVIVLFFLGWLIFR